MNCREAVELLGDEVDGSLGLLQRWQLRLHVWMCRHCRNYFWSYKTTLRAEKAALSELPDDLLCGRIGDAGRIDSLGCKGGTASG